ncbi:hypothetical protein Salat_1116300 [Sesamum alatum]|uniref:Uncharacterized protein n=1 Tax=Sesamum alatum TaxID=300844 RepID=A0AAE1YNL3_9LAMI|nr:hypothetical protein Salat_1116300 [Sesamum alatum]
MHRGDSGGDGMNALAVRSDPSQMPYLPRLDDMPQELLGPISVPDIAKYKGRFTSTGNGSSVNESLYFIPPPLLCCVAEVDFGTSKCHFFPSHPSSGRSSHRQWKFQLLQSSIRAFNIGFAAYDYDSIKGSMEREFDY